MERCRFMLSVFGKIWHLLYLRKPNLMHSVKLHIVNVNQENNSPRKADGDTVPLLRETMTLIPVSTKGTENSTTSDRSSLMVREPMAMSALLDTT